MKKIISILLVLSVIMAMGVSAFAVPSVSVDAAPVVESVAPAGTGAVAAEEETTVTVVKAEELEGEAKEAYDALAEAESVEAVCANIAEVLALVNADVAVEDLVVRDVFAVEFDEEAVVEEGYAVVTFDYAIEAGDVLVVLQYVDGEWVAIDPELVEVVDGKVIVKLANSGTLAFVTVAE